MFQLIDQELKDLRPQFVASSWGGRRCAPWRHEKITLMPVNPDFKPIVLAGADEGQLQVVAEFIEMLGREAED